MRSFISDWSRRLVLILAAACSGGPPRMGASPDGSVAPEDAGQLVAPTDGGGVIEATGEALFSARCAACHGKSGEGTALAYQIRSPVVPYATWVVRHGRFEQLVYPGAMSAFSAETLSDEELSLILAFLAAPAPTDGKSAYTRYCGNCHGSEGAGGRVEKPLVHKAHKEPDELTEKAREGHGGENYGERRKYMPSWTPAELPDQTLAAISAYLASLPDPGGDDDDDDDHH
ncbi:MAG: cytochrome c [Myxococcaceae bacterium]